MNSVIASSPHRLCRLTFLGISGPCPKPRARERPKAAGLGFNTPDRKARPRIRAPPPGSAPGKAVSLPVVLTVPGAHPAGWDLPVCAGGSRPSVKQKVRRKLSMCPVPTSVGASLSGRTSETRQHFTGCYYRQARRGEGLGAPGPCRASLRGVDTET